MLKAHMHVGCNVYEIQCQKQEQQSFQETAKVRESVMCVCVQTARTAGMESANRLPYVCLNRERTSMAVSCWLLHWHWGNPANCPLTATVSFLRNSGIPGRGCRRWGRNRWRACAFQPSSIVVLTRYSTEQRYSTRVTLRFRFAGTAILIGW